MGGPPLDIPPPVEPPVPPVDGDILQKILDLLKKAYNAGQSQAHIEKIVLSTGGTVQRVKDTITDIRAGIIQNISTEDVTVYTAENIAAGDGIILNAASAAGEAGGSMPVGNIDLHDIFFVRTTAGDTLAVYYET